MSMAEDGWIVQEGAQLLVGDPDSPIVSEDDVAGLLAAGPRPG